MFGIDVGKTAACVAAYQGDRVEVVANDYGNRTTPSLVLYDASCQEFLVGEPALAKAHKLTSSPEAAALLTPAKVSHVQFSKVKADAEAFIGQQMSSAVIAVPNRVSAEEREIITKAAGKCGVKSVRFLHSGIAVVLAHGLDVPVKGTEAPPRKIREKVLVYRLGGFNADVSVISVVDGAMTVLSSVSDQTIGGLQFDEALVQHCNTEFRKKYKMDVSGPRALGRLRAACEEARRSLSINARVSIEVDSLFEGLDFATVLTRPRFEDICHNLFRSVTKPIQAALSQANVTAGDVSRVLLAGGCVRMPKARDAIVSMFPGIPVDSRTNPEESVASGAAIAARLFSPAGGEGDAAAAAGAGAPNKGKGKKGGGKGKETSAEASVSTSGPVNMLGETQVATVHCPASIGIATEDGRLGVVIHRLALLPTSGSITLPLPAVDGVVTVTVYQGEEFETATANRGLVSLPLRSPVPSAATVEMKVTVVALATGALHIRAAVVGGEGSGVEVKLGPGVDAPPLAYEQESDLAQVLTFEPPAVAAVAEMNEKEAPKVEPPPLPAVATPVPAPKVAAPAPAAVKPASVPLVSADDLD